MSRKEVNDPKKKLRELIRPDPPKTLKERVWHLECDVSQMHNWLHDIEEALKKAGIPTPR
jgi:hypothetical protein